MKQRRLHFARRAADGQILLMLDPPLLQLSDQLLCQLLHRQPGHSGIHRSASQRNERRHPHFQGMAQRHTHERAGHRADALGRKRGPEEDAQVSRQLMMRQHMLFLDAGVQIKQLLHEQGRLIQIRRIFQRQRKRAHHAGCQRGGQGDGRCPVRMLSDDPIADPGDHPRIDAGLCRRDALQPFQDLIIHIRRQTFQQKCIPAHQDLIP